MAGVVIHMIIGLILFTPIGFIAGFLQHSRELKRRGENGKSQERQSDV